MKQNMDDNCASHVDYCLDIALWLVILMLCTDAPKTFQLYFFLEITPEHINI